MKKEWNGHKGKIVDSKNNYDVIECDVCKFKHIVPIPSMHDINKEYETNYYEEAKSLELYTKRYIEDEEWWNIVYGDRFNKFQEYFGCKENIRILDIGSGPGYFVQYGKENGWDVEGIEPSMKAVEYCKKRNLNVFCGFL